MKLFNISNNINFKAGKIHLFSDFDGTYCPAKHSSLHKDTPQQTYMMKNYCSKMNTFLKATEGDLYFHITTGRTFGEYEAICHLLKLRGFQLPLPESFIAKNGSDEYIKIGTNNFYSDGIFPFKYSQSNKDKENIIKNLTNWSGEETKNFIRDLAKKYKIRFVEAESENSVKDYGNNSLFSTGKLEINDWQKLPSKDGKIIQHTEPIIESTIGARKDGNLKINLIFSPDYGYCHKRNELYDNFMNEIKAFLSNKRVLYNIEWDVPSKNNHYRNHCNITPQIENGALTKFYDTKESLKKAIINNDILIVAGDGSNDFKMLNPLEYIDFDDWEKYKNLSNNKEFYNKNMADKLKDLRDVYNGLNNDLKLELERNGLLKRIEELPFYGIIIKKEDSKLKFLKDVFGKIGKIIEVENGELDRGIKEAVKNHVSINKSFNSSMSDKLKDALGLLKRKKKDYKCIITFICIVTAIILGTICYKKRKEINYENTIN